MTDLSSFPAESKRFCASFDIREGVNLNTRHLYVKLSDEGSRWSALQQSEGQATCQRRSAGGRSHSDDVATSVSCRTRLQQPWQYVLPQLHSASSCSHSTSSGMPGAGRLALAASLYAPHITVLLQLTDGMHVGRTTTVIPKNKWCLLCAMQSHLRSCFKKPHGSSIQPSVIVARLQSRQCIRPYPSDTDCSPCSDCKAHARRSTRGRP